jgi:hypothetical protein
MTLTAFQDDGGTSTVSRGTPLPTHDRALDEQPFVTSRADVVTKRITVPGLTAAAAFAANDQFGGLFPIPDMARVRGGTFAITKVTFFDLDDEGLPKVLHLFSRQDMTLAGDNNAWALTDAGVVAYLGAVALNVFQDHGNNQTCTVNPALYCKCDDAATGIWGVFQTLGIDNIAAGSMPIVEIMALRD